MFTTNKKVIIPSALLVIAIITLFFYSRFEIQKKALALRTFVEYMSTVPENQTNADRYESNTQLLRSEAFQKVASLPRNNIFLAAVGAVEVLDIDGNTYYCNNLSNKISDMIDTVMDTYPGVVARHDQEFANKWLDGWIKNIQIQVNYFREDCALPRLSNG